MDHLQAPTLVFHGVADPLVPLRTSQLLASSCPDLSGAWRSPEPPTAEPGTWIGTGTNGSPGSSWRESRGFRPLPRKRSGDFEPPIPGVSERLKGPLLTLAWTRLESGDLDHCPVPLMGCSGLRDGDRRPTFCGAYVYRCFTALKSTRHRASRGRKAPAVPASHALRVAIPRARI